MGCVKSSFYKIIFLTITVSYIAIGKPVLCESNPPQNLSDLTKSNTSRYQILELWDQRSPINQDYLLKGVIFKDINTNMINEAYYLNNKLLPPEEVEKLGVQHKKYTSIKELSIPSEKMISISPKNNVDTLSNLDKVNEFSALEDVELITLPPLSKEKLVEEEVKSLVKLEKGIYKIGIIEELPEKVRVIGENPSHSYWQLLPNGSLLWAIDIEFPESIGIRVNILSNTTTSEKVEFWVIPISANTQPVGPFNTKEILSLSNWLPTCFSDKVRVICSIHPEGTINEVYFEISEVIGIYQDPIQLLTKAGSCNLDFTCYPEWANVGKGVVGLGVVSSPYALFCTGTLIADNDPCTQIPYILTANHCVSSQSGYRSGDTVEFYWFYQTSTCNGTPPSLSTVPRTTGGADYLAGMGGNAYYGGGNDFTLLRMRNSPPEEAVFVGWTTAVIAIGTSVTDIHHPSGSYKRISFGKKTNNQNPYSYYYHEVTWDEGTTEPGSSGSPLMLTATKQIIGQLWGGGASCSTPTEPDYFGRFDVTYRFAQDFLEPPAVSFSETSFLIEEQNYTKEITLTLNLPARSNGGEVSIRIETTNATEGVDFALSSQTVAFTPNSTQNSLSFNLFDNTHTEQEKKIKLTLENPQCLRLADVNLSYEITIVDNDPDTDGDGLSDYDEINGVWGYPSDPYKVDSDYDGISDYDEIMGTHGYQTNPINRDTDGDRVPDWFEIRYGSDPTDNLSNIPFETVKIPWFINAR